MFFNQLIAGDVLLRKKGDVWHFGIYMGSGWVLHNSPGIGERITSFSEYANGEQVKAYQPDSSKRHEIMERAWEIVRNPKAYDHLTRNCEHTAYEAIEGEAKSPTVRAVIGTVAVIALVVLGIRYHKEIAKALRSTIK